MNVNITIHRSCIFEKTWRVILDPPRTVVLTLRHGSVTSSGTFLLDELPGLQQQPIHNRYTVQASSTDFRMLSIKNFIMMNMVSLDETKLSLLARKSC
jgi:hypothetical protein